MSTALMETELQSGSTLAEGQVAQQSVHLIPESTLYPAPLCFVPANFIEAGLGPAPQLSCHK